MTLHHGIFPTRTAALADTCPECHGETEILEDRDGPFGSSEVAVPCPCCDGGHSLEYWNRYQRVPASAGAA